MMLLFQVCFDIAIYSFDLPLLHTVELGNSAFIYSASLILSGNLTNLITIIDLPVLNRLVGGYGIFMGTSSITLNSII